jgi:AI-2 transport protein TqsA
MAVSLEPKIALAIAAAVAVSFAAYHTASVFAPLVLALFIIAIVWPLQQRLQSFLPTLVALAITIIVLVAVCFAFASLVVWGFGRVGRAMVSDAGRYQALYDSLVTGQACARSGTAAPRGRTRSPAVSPAR